MTNQNISDRTKIGSPADNRIPSDLAALAGQIARQKRVIEAMPEDGEHDDAFEWLARLRAEVVRTRARSLADLQTKAAVVADEVENADTFDSDEIGSPISLVESTLRDVLSLRLAAPDKPRPAPDDATGSLLTALLPVAEYDFASGEAIVGGARITRGGRIAIPLRRVVAVCQRHEPGANVLIDGAIPARVILHTEAWAVVMPEGAQTPSVVEPTRMRFIGAPAKDSAAA